MYTVTDLFLAGSDSSILSHGSFDVVRKLRNKERMQIQII